jgi:molybdate transport system substrate-binding protein
VVLVTALLALARPNAHDAPVVYAATSLTGVAPRLDDRATYSFGGSSTLQVQIEHGAPADLFLAAGPQEAQALYRAGRCDRPVTFATNRLVLVVPRGDPAGVRSLGGLRRGGLKLSVGNASVPIGDYTRSLLRRMGLSHVLRDNTVSQQSNVGQVLAQVAYGGADAGFVYATDARTQRDRLQTVALPERAQPPVRYQACVVRRDGVDRGGALRLLGQLRSPRGRAVLASFGFGLPPRR